MSGAFYGYHRTAWQRPRTARARGTGRLALVALAVIAFSACGGTASSASPHPRAHRSPDSTPPSTAQRITGAATLFMNLLVQGKYGAQWALLSPQAQQQWPSQQARDQMLATKYAGMTLTYTLGTPVANQIWTSPETLVHAQGVWQVPCSLSFTGGAPQLPGTALSYTSVPLYLATDGPGSQIVGEGPASMDAPVLLPATAPPVTLTVPVLMYHDVAPPPDPANYATPYGYDLQYQLTVPPDQFGQQMDWLAQSGYHAISLARLADALYDGLPLPPNPVVITFDDGFLGQYANALPILQSHGFTATFFICTGLVGWQTNRQQYATWDQLREMSSDGFWIEDHTVTDDTSNYGQSTAVLDQLLLSTQQVLEQKIARPIQFFAYSSVWPYESAQMSGPLVDNIVPVLRQGGYQLAVTDPRDWSNQVSSTQPYQVPRIRVSPDEPLDQFASELTG